MGPNVSYKAVILFAGITFMLFSNTNTHSSTSHNDDSSPEDSIPEIKSLPNKVNPECGPLTKSVSMNKLTDILTFDIFSQADPSQYLIEKIMKMNVSGNETILDIIGEVSYALGTRRLALCYVPFAYLLISLLKCRSYLLSVNKYVSAVRIQHSTNVDGLNSLQLEISSSAELSELFSSDIIFNSESPMRLFNKLLRMSDDEIVNLKIQLQNFSRKWMPIRVKDLPFSSMYRMYAHTVFELLRDKTAFGSLKRNMAEIQHVPTSNESMANV